MKRNLLVSLALAFTLLLTGCAGGTAQQLTAQNSATPVEAKRDPALDLAYGDFSLALLRETRSPGEDVCLSPLSVLLAMAMAENGADGQTLEALGKTLAGGGSQEDFNANCASLLEDYANLGEGTVLTIAQSLWLDGRMHAEEPFIARCTDTYRAQVFSTDFTQSGAVKDVNRWIKEQTGGKMDGALEEIDPDTVLALISALYFEGKWAEEFDPKDTEKGMDFYRADGTVGQVDYMNNDTRHELYFTTEDGVGVLLPYRDERLAFFALLPDEGIGVDGCLERLDGAALAACISSAESTLVSLKLPKFTAQWKGSLVKQLKAMGLEAAFDPARAEFAPMGKDENGNPLYISMVEHGAGIEVEEQGTKAFSFTMIGMMAGGMAMADPIVLTFDRPFVYGIVDLERGIPLFLGTFEHS